MLFLMIGIVVVVAVGALLKQQARHAVPEETPAQPIPNNPGEEMSQPVSFPPGEPDLLVLTGSSEERPVFTSEKSDQDEAKEKPASPTASEEQTKGQTTGFLDGDFDEIRRYDGTIRAPLDVDGRRRAASSTTDSGGR